MFNQIKIYIATAAAVVISIFWMVFKKRGQDIENLNTELAAEKEKAIVVDKVVEAKEKKYAFEAESRVEKAKAEAKDYENITDNFYNI